MILKSLIGNSMMMIPCCSRCFASNSINREQLCSQLNQLYREADTTRLKATNARQRLMRLSDAAEKLRRQAAIDLQKGKEDEARDLLFQKKKIIQAMHKSEARIQLLDQLCSKLNQAISLKESQLVCDVDLDVDVDVVDKKDSQIPVRIVSPIQQVAHNINENKDLISSNNDDKLVDSQKIALSVHNLSNDADKYQFLSLAENEDNLISSLQNISSYDDFLEHIDIQFHKIEAELVSVLNASTILLGNEEIKRNSRVEQTKELLDSVREIRHR
ncbi:hypothetical protein ACFE04_029247 [Oxalis oulophora]